MSEGYFLADLRAAVEQMGVTAVAEAAFITEARVRQFLRDPESIRISTFSRLCRAVGLPHGEFHLIDRKTDKCIVCDRPRSEHYPLCDPEREGAA